MQDEVNEKTIALYIKTGKLTAQTLQKAMKAILSKGKKALSKPPQGKQSLKQLMKQNAGVSNIEITKDNIKAFESTYRHCRGGHCPADYLRQGQEREEVQERHGVRQRTLGDSRGHKAIHRPSI